MTKNTLNLILLVIVIALIAAIYFSEQENTELNPLTNLTPDSISKIVISREKQKVSITKQKNKQWLITQPTTVAANKFRINSLLKLVSAPIHSQYSLEELDPEVIALEKTATRIAFDQHIIQFGTINPVTNLRYVKINNTIYTIEDVYYPLINSHFSTLVAFNLLPEDRKIAKLTLPNQIIEQDVRGRWTSNINTPADDVSKILDLWENSQAFGVHEYIDRENLAEIEILLKQSKQEIRFIVTDITPWLIIARPEIGLEYHLEIESYSQLFNNIDLMKSTK